MRSEADDITENRHGGSDTSAAANPTQASKRARKDLIYGYLMTHGSATVDELSAYFNLPPNEISGRISEMKREGIVRDSGERRVTRKGKKAAVIIRTRYDQPKEPAY
jgi:Mn-dependent DtxR family transcriptional regulator